MPTLLHLDSSADLTGSRSRAITRTFADAWRGCGPGHVVVHRDLHRDPPPHLSDTALHWPARLRAVGSSPAEDAVGRQQAYLDELLAADVLLVAAPLYNYSLPSTLKAWVDHVHVPGLTAAFDIDSRPMAGRPAVVVRTRGASYDPGTPTDGWDHGTPVLQLVLGTALGMDITVITTDLTLAETVPALSEHAGRARDELAAAHERAAAMAAELGRR